MKRKNLSTETLPSITKKETNITNPKKIDRMSLAGVGNSIAGSALVRIAESLLTLEINKPAHLY